MAVLTDTNLTSYKKYLDDLSTQLGRWSSYLSTARNNLNSSTGSTFRTQYSKGKKATTNITSILDILTRAKADLDKLVKDSNDFYTTSYNASKK